MPLLTFAKRTLSLLLFAAIALAPEAAAVETSPPRILDLSKPFPMGNTDNTDAAFFTEVGLSRRDIRRFLVIENGDVVVDYQRDNVVDDDAFHLFSATKVVMSMIIGTIISSDEYDLSLDDTLGDLFTGENDWIAIEDPDEVAFKQNVTILELLTMSSGLTMTGGTDPLSLPGDLPNMAGRNLQQSLAFHGWNATIKGEYEYLAFSNVLSYVIVAATGMTPREYSSVEVFPYLGIDNNIVEWHQNFGGVETSLSNLFLTARDMAKVAQLYLQKGLATPDKRLLSEEFVEASLVPRDVIHLGYPTKYGYFWFINQFNTSVLPNQIGQAELCGQGLLEQGYCFNYESKRVVAYQRSNTLWDFDNSLFDLGQTIFSANFTFNETVEPTAVASSGARHHFESFGTVVVAFALSIILARWL